MVGAKITAIGTYVPEKKLTNFELERMVETSDEWIIQRTGIQERRISAQDEFTSDLCVSAVEDMMRRYNKTITDVDMIIVATSTPDFSFPSVSCIIQERLRISQSAGAMDLNAACAGFVYALHTAHSFITSGLHKKVLVIGADTLSKITDYSDRNTCILFGDGAGAVLVERDVNSDYFIKFNLGSDGRGAPHVYRTGLANKMNGVELIDNEFLVQNGREVLRWVVRTIPNCINQLLNNAQMEINDVDWFIPHSANLRLIEPICEKINFSITNTLYSLVNFGNTSAATIPLSLDIGIREGKIKNGNRVLMYGFGAGLTHAGQLIKVNFDEQLSEPRPY